MARGKVSYLDYSNIKSIKIVDIKTNDVKVEYTKEHIPPGINSLFLNVLYQVWDGCIYLDNKIYKGVGGEKTYPEMNKNI